MDQILSISIPLCVCMVVFVPLSEVWAGSKGWRPLRVTLFCIYLFLNFCQTLIGRKPMPQMRCEPVPFWSYRLALAGDAPMAVGIVLNILLYVPFGFLLDDSRHLSRHPWLIVLLGFLLSLATETVQLVTRLGTFEVDDLINNTLGTLIGVACYRLLKILVARWRR